jgi:hypothetical protein
MENKKFGKLLVIDYVGTNKRGEKLWRCVCDCGNEKNVKSYNLNSGHTKSCGCDKTGPKEENYIGKKFNRLTVLRMVGRDKWRTQILECECECGQIKKVLLTSLKRGLTKSCGCWNVEVRRNASGEKNPNYKKELTDEDRIIGRGVPGYDEWKQGVKERDNYICQCCFKSKSGRLVSHHLDSYHANKEKRCDLENGICLCIDCHNAFHKKFGRLNNTKEQFKEFLKIKNEIINI